MDEALASANRRIDDMSFKDPTARAAAAMARKPAESATSTAKAEEPKPDGSGTVPEIERS